MADGLTPTPKAIRVRLMLLEDGKLTSSINEGHRHRPVFIRDVEQRGEAQLYEMALTGVHFESLRTAISHSEQGGRDELRFTVAL